MTFSMAGVKSKTPQSKYFLGKFSFSNLKKGYNIYFNKDLRSDSGASSIEPKTNSTKPSDRLNPKTVDLVFKLFVILFIKYILYSSLLFEYLDLFI